MKKQYFLVVCIFSGLLFSYQVSTFKVEGLMCVSGCVWKVNTVAQSILGVNESNVDFERGILTVQYDPKKVNDDLIIKELSKQTTYKITKIQNKANNNKILDWFNNIFN